MYDTTEIKPMFETIDSKKIIFYTNEELSQEIKTVAMNNIHLLLDIETDFHEFPKVITRLIFKDSSKMAVWSAAVRKKEFDYIERINDEP